MREKSLNAFLAILITTAATCFNPVQSEPETDAESTKLLTVTLLGTGSPAIDTNRFGASTLVEVGDKLFLFDSGRGAATRISQIGNPYNILPRLRHVFLTHLHSDHIIGLADIYMTGWVYGRKESIHIAGPSGSQAMMDNLRKTYESDIAFRSEFKNTKNAAAGLETSVKEIDQGQIVYDQGGVKIAAFLVDHGHVEPAFGYKIEYAGKTVILSGDTSYSENLIRQAKNADLIIHEVAQVSPALLKARPKMQKVLGLHTLPYDAGRVFSAATPKLAVYSHLVLLGVSEDELLSQTRETYSGRLLIGHDLMKIVVGDEITVHPANAVSSRSTLP